MDYSWKTVSAAEGQTYNVGHLNNVFCYGGLVFAVPDLRLAKINKIILNVRFDAQPTLSGKGKLYGGVYVYSNLSSAKNADDYLKTGLSNLPSVQEFDFTKQHSDIFQNFPDKVGFTMSFYATEDFNTATQYVKANYYLSSLTIDYETFDPLIPDTLSPNGANRHPGSSVDLSWRYNKNINIENDYQLYSVLSYRVNSGVWTDVTLYNTNNTYTFPSSTFTSGSTVYWRVRTCSMLGLSDYSETASFSLASTPPLQPLLSYPLNVAVNAGTGALLEWRYNSQYDTSPSRFDIQYRVDNGNWTSLTNSGQTSIKTYPILTQSQVEWQVRAYGQMGDAGAWSSIGLFWTIGIPQKPVIVRVSNNSHPVVTFSSSNILSWAMEFVDENGDYMHKTGDIPFDGSFTYRVPEIFKNGNYTVRMNVRNEYGLESDWAYLAFRIDLAAIPPLELKIMENMPYGIKLSALLHGNSCGENDILQIFRSSDGKKYIQIAEIYPLKYVEHQQYIALTDYVDYSAASGITYYYQSKFLKADDTGYTDSNTVLGKLNFYDTVIMEVDNSESMVSLLYLPFTYSQAKTMEISREKALTRLAGREFPVLQTGAGITRTYTLGFLCSFSQLEKLKKLAESTKTLCLRDWRWGSAFGTISGKLRVTPAGVDHSEIYFTFHETEYGG